MKIHRWLIAIVILLMVPSLLFATLWIGQTLGAVRAVDRSLAALDILTRMEPQIRKLSLGEPAPPLDRALDADNLLGLSPTLLAKFEADQKDLASAVNTSSAARAARSIARTAVHAVDLTSVVSVYSAELGYLISDTLLSVVLEASAMVQTGERIAMKDEVNVWDKMAVTVQGGQFKISADAVARVSKTEFSMLPRKGANRLIELGADYRATNGEYQRNGAKLLTSILQAETGSQVNYQPAMNAFPKLAKASLDLWRGSIDYLVDDLNELRRESLLAVATAGASSLITIVIALAMAAALGRSLSLRTQEKFDQLGYHDPLTQLPNRRALVRALGKLMTMGKAMQPGAVLIDLRSFKSVNSRYGDHIGDNALKSVGADLERLAREGDIVARTGGAEFMILRPYARSAESMCDFAAQVVSALTDERTIGDQHLRLDASVGVAVARDGECPTKELITQASLALRHAKLTGGKGISLFAPQMREQLDKQTRIARDLKAALESGKIVPWFQPQISLDTGDIVGAEALVRWVDDAGGVRFPGSFLPAAAEAGLMEHLDQSIRQLGLSMAAKATAMGVENFHLGLNVTSSMLLAGDCVDLLAAEVERFGLHPSQVSIEILEAVMIDEIASAPIMANVSRLSALGFYIELDDFGTGHSSISSLRDLKIDRVKIDRSFISGVDTDEELQQFTGTLIQLAKGLGVAVLAEGVETEGERTWLAENGCDVIQGYLISKAVSEEQILAKLARQCTHAAALLA